MAEDISSFEKIKESTAGQKFRDLATNSGVILLLATFAAIMVANSPWSQQYFDLWDLHFTVGFGEAVISKPLLMWINDGMMAMFFFVVGLEIKREIIDGELSDMRKAVLPVAAAIGGMVVPALIYHFINLGQPSHSGWGIPMATDIAFSLGILALLGKRVPMALKIFLTAFAIVDDLGAVLVIAFFYSSHISFLNLTLGVGFVAIMVVGNFLGVRNAYFYAILGIGGVWLAFLLSGVHATIAGVLAAMAIPADTKLSPISFVRMAKTKLLILERNLTPDNMLLTRDQVYIIESLKQARKDAESPLQRLEYALHPVISFIVMPVFAFSNAGVILEGVNSSLFSDNLFTGIVAGLVFGKVGGIMLFSWLACKFNLAILPEGLRWVHISGAALLGGVGFTMSLFIAGLAFGAGSLLDVSKMAILFASFIAGVAGYIVLSRSLPRLVYSTSTDQ